MSWPSIIAIYVLFWALSLFLVLPFRLTSSSEPEDFVPGQVESATPRFSLRRTAYWTTIVAAVLFGSYYLNYVNAWITPATFDGLLPALVK